MIVSVLGINQPKIIAFNDYSGANLGLNDLAFIQFVNKAALFENNYVDEETGRLYVHISLDTVQKALPIIEIDSEEILNKYIDSLADLKIFDGIMVDGVLYIAVSDLGETLLS